MRAALALLLVVPVFAGEGPRLPMKPRFEDSAMYRWLQKPVLETRLLDDMENPSTWVHSGFGEMIFTREHAIDGHQSLRLQGRLELTSGYNSESITATRPFPGEDWSKFNRLSFWVYPNLPGFHNISMQISLHNDGAYKVPAMWNREGFNTFELVNGKWNHIVWEIANLARDKVTSVVIEYLNDGWEPQAERTVTFDLAHLELQRVDADHFEGWDVAPGRISFSGSGYATGAPKSALASGLAARAFRVVRQDTGEVVLSKAVRDVQTNLGRFQVLDFSEVQAPGPYVLRAGNEQTPPFAIGDNVWRPAIFKAINFFYTERCGTEIPGVHGVCHLDWQGVHGDKRIIINGGWHDAGDLSQMLFNTGEAVYAMLSLAEKLRMRDEDPELSGRLVEEGKWGLAWVLKTHLGEGYRIAASGMAHWTDGILGDSDDIVEQATQAPYEDFVAAAAEALAARVLKTDDPGLTAYCLRTARDDWQFGVEAMGQNVPHRHTLGEKIDALSTGVLASGDLWRATGDQRYADQAREYAQVLVTLQERKLHAGWKAPITGYFYTSPEKEEILHYSHPGHAQGPIVALARMCEDFPNDPDWMKWYSAVALHSEFFLKAMSQFTEPYGVLPASVYRDDEYLQAPQDRRESYRRQILNGIEVGPGYHLRLFPVWFERRGTNGTFLSESKALSAAAHLRGDLETADLAEKQLEWVAGRNPFAQSIMYGEGYDFAPMYSTASGDIVGALSVGIETRDDSDIPYWPAATCYNYKEVWTHATSRWLYLVQDLAGPALVMGRTQAGPLEFHEKRSGQSIAVPVNAATGAFRAWLPEGVYEVQGKSLTVLPSATYDLDLVPGHDFDFSLSSKTDGAGGVRIAIAARGKGTHQLVFRTDNLTLARQVVELNLDSPQGATAVLPGHIDSQRSPWVAVAVPDGNLAERQELIGAP
jgi:hypothetical protein